MYEDSVSKYIKNLTKLRGNIDSIVSEVPTTDEPQLTKTKLLEYFDTYEQESGKFSDYLLSARTLEAVNENVIQVSSLSELREIVNSASIELDARIPQQSVHEPELNELGASIPQQQSVKELKLDSQSLVSKRSARSNISKSSSFYVQQKAKLEAAKVRQKYVEQECLLAQQRADIEVNMKLLQSKRDIEEAECELKVLDQCFDDHDRRSSEVELIPTKRERVEQYIEQQHPISRSVDHKQILRTHEPVLPALVTHTKPPHVGRLNSNAPDFVPHIAPDPSPQTGQIQLCREISKFLMRKDLLLSRLTKFDDRSEYFDAWRLSFKNIVYELELSSLEELELLGKWLGPESSKYAQSIRVANADPDTACEKLWERLEDRYARPEMVEVALKQKLSNFPRLSNKDSKRLFDLADILAEIEAAKENPRLSAQFAYFDSSVGVNPIVSKLPYGIQEKWTAHASKYKARSEFVFPPFSVFVNFLQGIAKMKNDPSFIYDVPSESKASRDTKFRPSGASSVVVRKTDIPYSESKPPNSQLCPVHGTRHSLNMCRAFRRKPLSERIEFLKNNNICHNCCSQTKHLPSNCKKTGFCVICKQNNHPTALHVYADNLSRPFDKNEVTTSCTMVCKDPLSIGKSCAKTVLVTVYPADDPSNFLRMYAIIDEQSNKSLAKSTFFDYFHIGGPDIPYSLSSCSGQFTQSGRRASDFVIESIDNSCRLRLPTLIECDQLPSSKEEIPTPEVAKAYRHLADISHKLPPLEPNTDILLLIGRDLLSAHHVLDQRLGGPDVPYAQKLNLGWVVIGESCLGSVHKQNAVSVYKTFTLTDGRVSHLEPCPNNVHVKDDIFIKTKLDDVRGLSVEDKKFIQIMDDSFHRDSDGCWTAPLPFKEHRERLPNNRPHALKRANIFASEIRKNDVKREHVINFMEKIFRNGHAELASPLQQEEECWFLPIFAVYHPKKRDSVRCVFDSSAKYGGVSLNDVLLTGPDLINSLLGILLRFRQHPVAATADIEQMFYRFTVPPEHRNYLRFFWFRDNNPDLEFVEYRMTRHVFGNSPSPAIAAFGLKKTVSDADDDVRKFVKNNFYVDDALTSLDSPEETVSLLCRTQNTLQQEGNIRLCKIASNDREVINAFPPGDLATDMENLDLDLNYNLVHRPLGVSWNISTDSFTFQVSRNTHPFTKRGVLATINSLYDPIGFLSPVVLRGKLIMKELVSGNLEWDDPLPDEQYSQWFEWQNSLPELERISVKRAYVDIPSSEVIRRELHIFSDASQKAIAAVAYMKIFDISGKSHLSFVLGKAKVAPTHGHTVPRLELCGAVLATQLKDSILTHLDVPIDDTCMYTDSKVVLGYIYNEQRRFYIYVGNRVDKIRQSTVPQDWKYVPSENNPADIGTRSVSVDSIGESEWLQGPKFLKEDIANTDTDCGSYHLVDAEADKEIRNTVVTLQTSCATDVDCSRFHKFSRWSILIRAICVLKHIAKSFAKTVNCNGWHYCTSSTDTDIYRETELFILKQVQREHFPNEIKCCTEGRAIPKNSSIISLSPFLDENGLLRVGGRLNRAREHLNRLDVNPIIVPKNSHIDLLLVRHYHETVQHQGRRITDGRLRSAGYWIIGVKRLLASVIHKCVICRKLRGSFCAPKMADLPEDRLQPGPPFSFVGVDVFGQWNVIVRRTRGGQASRKRWAVLFTCLVSRAIHIEVIEDLSSSSFINALRRFIAIRGPVKQFRSDRGTNFVGAVQELNLNSVFVESVDVQKVLKDNACTWIFNPPHASHFGGVWERMIGVARKVLDAILLRSSARDLTHDTLSTVLAEVCAIVNSRPILPVSNDPDDPTVLTPAVLLTHKVGKLPDVFPSLGTREMYKSQWKYVQVIAQEFWTKWSKEYVNTLQNRFKWTTDQTNLQEGDIVLLKDNDVVRNQWPTAIVHKIHPDQDGCVRVVEVRCSKQGKPVTYVRPVHELIPLIP